MKYILCIALLVSACTAKNSPIEPDKLVGIWNLLPDTSSQSFFNGKNRLDYYRGYTMAAFDYTISNNVLIDTDRKNGEVYQYDIIVLTDDSLTLKHIRSGHVLNYRKSKSTIIVRRPN